MSDIFEIKKQNIELKIGDRVFGIKDPKFADKIMLKKEWDALQKAKDSMDDSDYMLAAHKTNLKMVLMYIPEMDSEFLENELPSSALDLLMKKITDLTESKFGAVLEKSEKK